jgi:hypothetical protein
LLPLATLALAACVDGPRDPVGVRQPFASTLAQVSQQDTPDQMAVAQVVPGFGGYFIDERGRPTVYLTDPSRRAEAEQALAGFLGSYGWTAADLRVRQADYDYLQLDGWYRGAWPSALAVDGAVFSDIDEGTNRLRFGGVDAGAVASIAGAIAGLAVPSAAVVVEVAGPVAQTIAPPTTLQDTVRPVHGAYQINFLDVAGVRTVSFLCTLGFNAVKDGVSSFVTNSHCSNVQGGSETPTEYYQPLMDPDGDRLVNPDLFIGTEVHDPHYFISLDCPPGRMCRYSDAARAEYGLEQEFLLGRIGRTVRSDPQVGPLDVDATNPMFRVVAEQPNQVIGEIVNKVGRTTGWTFGAVFATCVNVNITASNITQLCQNRSRAGVGSGDSGSPVFTANTDGTVNLGGIIWGSSTNLVTGEVTSIYTPFSGIERELGELTTADPDGGKKVKKKPRA